MALGPDGRVPTAHERRTLQIERLITSSNPLNTLSDDPGIQSNPFFGFDGPAASKLATDLHAESEHTRAVDLIIAASARFFIDSLHSEAFLADPPLNSVGETIRFDNTYLRCPSELAMRLGALTYTLSTQYGTHVSRMLLSAEACKRGLGLRAIHPCFEKIQGRMELPQVHTLLAQAMTAVATHLGTVMVLPNKTCTGLDLGYWKTWDRVEFVTLSAQRALANVEQEIGRDRQLRKSDLQLGQKLDRGGQRTRIESQLLDLISETIPMSMSEFVDRVLPPESQAALAYEGLYRAQTEKERTPGLAVTFAGAREQIFTSNWAKLFNHLVSSHPLLPD